MAIAINFDRAKTEKLLDALVRGKALPAVHDVDDILALGGACFFLALSRGVELKKAAAHLRVAPPRDDDDDEEEDTFVPEIHAALEYYGQLTLLVANGEYEDHFDPKHKAVVTIEDGEKTVVPLDGMRDGEDE